MFLDGGTKPEYPERTHTYSTQGEHAQSTQKEPNQDLKQEPSCCELTVLTTTPLCSPYGAS